MNLFLEGLAPAWAATPPRKEVALFRDSVPLTEDVASCPAEGSSTRSLAAASPRRGLVQEVKQKPPGLWSLPLPHPALASGEGLALSEPRVPN